MQVGIDVTYMYIDFGERDLFSFGDTATFKFGQLSIVRKILQYMYIFIGYGSIYWNWLRGPELQSSLRLITLRRQDRLKW